MPKVHEFATIPSLLADTQLYTQRRSAVESPANYRFTVETLAMFLIDNYSLAPIKGAYASDAAAGADGVAVDELYELTAGNVYGLPAGVLKKRKN